jgi:hypothetical protein
MKRLAVLLKVEEEEEVVSFFFPPPTGLNCWVDAVRG